VDKGKYISTPVFVGSLPLGGNWPVRIQSMTNTDTLDTAASVAQSIRIIEAGGELVRLTAQGVREAENLRNIKEGLRRAGYEVPLVADIHFNPAAAETAASIVEKVRINPGNYVDKRATFQSLNLSEKEYSEELERIHQRLLPLIEICQRNKTVIRVGINHGSLSDRIMDRYGNTPEGMTASAMEFISIFRAENFNNLVISMKSSNTAVMVDATRQLVVAMKLSGCSYPFHLGVTEAGEGEDGRIRSAAGIGALLAEGIGDTIRVSLSEPPENEIPVAKQIIGTVCGPSGRAENPSEPVRFVSHETSYRPQVISRANGLFYAENGELFTGKMFEINKQVEGQPSNNIFGEKFVSGEVIGYSVGDGTRESEALKAAATVGRYFISREAGGIALYYGDGGKTGEGRETGAEREIGEGMETGEGSGGETNGNSSASKRLSQSELKEIAFSILQATEARITANRYISCPTCGRTKFDLPTAVRRVKEATKHLTGLKIAVMGCIVNGPGEMAGADWGYVGAGEGKIHIYRGSKPILKNIPEEEAIERLLELINAEQ